MIEKIARAIADNMPPSRDLSELGFVSEESLREAARAALEAMKEPTPAMVEAGFQKHMGSEMSSVKEERENVEDIYKAMMEAALK